jgi:hypothetical protein
MKYKVAVVTVWFGPLPNHIPLFIASCKYNPDIDFFFVSDSPPASLPANVTPLKMTFEDVKQRLQNLFDFPIRLSTPYKICDYRIVYGMLFSDLLVDYNYWGFCDCDLVFGDIGSFLDQIDMSAYYRVFKYGQLVLFRNNPAESKRMLELEPITRAQDFRFVYTHDHNYYFDESGSVELLQLHNIPVYTEQPYFDINYKKYQITAAYNWDDSRKRGVLLFDHGKITHYYADKNKGGGGVEASDPWLFAHFQKRPLEIQTDLFDEFYLLPPNKIVSKSAFALNYDNILRVTRYHPYWHYMRWRINYYFKFLRDFATNKNEARQRLKWRIEKVLKPTATKW